MSLSKAPQWQNWLGVLTLLICLIGFYETWFGSGLPGFVVILLSAIFTGAYGLARLTDFASAPAFNLPYVFRGISSLFLILILWGEWRNSGTDNMFLIVALLASFGINGASIFKSKKKVST